MIPLFRFRKNAGGVCVCVDPHAANGKWYNHTKRNDKTKMAVNNLWAVHSYFVYFRPLIWLQRSINYIKQFKSIVIWNTQKKRRKYVKVFSYPGIYRLGLWASVQHNDNDTYFLYSYMMNCISVLRAHTFLDWRVLDYFLRLKSDNERKIKQEREKEPTRSLAIHAKYRQKQ